MSWIEHKILSKMDKSIANIFFLALQEGNLDDCRLLLESAPELAAHNFSPESLHTEGFPIYQASKTNNLEIVRLLLEKGADPDAALDLEDPREVGMPLMHALELGNLDMANLLLDHGARLHAFPYCSTPFVDKICNMLWDEEGSEKKVAYLMSKSYKSYISFERKLEKKPSQKESELMRLLERVVEMGGRPSLFTVVRHQNHALLQELLRTCPNQKGPVSDWPQDTVFKNIAYGASWTGYPKTLVYCKELCPELYSTDVSKQLIDQAIRSHNRDGCIEEYYELIRAELEFLRIEDANEMIFSTGEVFDPIHTLETDFIEPKNYGFKCPTLLTQEDLERVRGLFKEYGY